MVSGATHNNRNINAVVTVESLNYLVVKFSNNAKWATHVEEIFIKCVRFPVFVKKLRELSIPADFIHKFAKACVLDLIFNCFLAILPGLLKHDCALLKHTIKLISLIYGLSFSYLANLACQPHIKASSDFATRILGAVSSGYFQRLLQNSDLPVLPRLLVHRNAELNYIIQKLF